MTHKQQILIVMGPTGSGKSAFGLRIAQARPAVIINADAMQLVDTLRVITARPTVEEEAQAEHALYGVLKPAESTSVAVWLRLVAPVIRRAWAEGKLPVLLGGTGMYVQALMEGLSAIPAIPADVRARVRSWGEAANIPPPGGGRLGGGHGETLSSNSPPPQPSPYGGGGTTLHALLLARDPVMAAKLKSGDTQRLLRALEVVEATDQSLDVWQKMEKTPLFPEAQFTCAYMAVTREAMYRAIDQRFEIMMKNGALDEVRALMALNLPADTPILRAHGVPELMAYLRGDMTLERAVELAQQHTRNYAKRQMTWLRNQLPDALPITPGSAVPDVIFTIPS